MASLDQEQAELEKALATSADEHARLVAAKQTQELLLVEHLSSINISAGSKGEQSYRHSDKWTDNVSRQTERRTYRQIV